MKDKNKEKQGKISYILTRETMGMTLMLFSVIVLIMLLTFNTVFAGIGAGVCTFMYGTFGYGSILLTAVLAYLGEWLTFEKSIKIAPKKVIAICFTAFAAVLLFHAVTTRNYSLDLSYGEYIKECYMNAQFGYSGYTFGGVISALLVYPVAKLGGFVTAYVLFSVLVLLCVYLTFLAFRHGSGATAVVRKSRRKAYDDNPSAEVQIKNSVVNNAEVSVRAEAEIPAEEPKSSVNRSTAIENKPETKQEKKNYGNKILFDNGEFSAESYRRNMIFNDNSYFNSPAVSSEEDYLSSFSLKKPSKPKTYTESYKEQVLNQPVSQAPSSYVYGEKPVENLSVEPEPEYGQEHENDRVEPLDEPSRETYDDEPMSEIEEPVRREPSLSNLYRIEEADKFEEDAEETLPDYSDEPEIEPVRDIPTVSRDRVAGFSERAEARETVRKDTSDGLEEAQKKEDDIYGFLNDGVGRSDRGRGRTERSNSELFDDDDESTGLTDSPFLREAKPSASVERIRGTAERREAVKPAPVPEPVPEAKPEKPKHVWKKYVRPSLDLLDDYPENANVNTGEIEDNKRVIVETLDRFKIASEVANVTIGPAITRYDVIIQDKTNIKRALGYRDAIAMELRKDNVNTYLNYTKGAMSIEVPNNRRTIVGLKSMLASQKYINSKPSSLTFALGKNVDGEVVCPDITKMPHLLVAGTTGSGKSICLSALLVSLLYKYGPEELRLILVDPKQVEFISYDGLPHLMINEIIYECDKAIKALNWAIKEMERRYTLFKDMTSAGTATKNLDEYNAHLPAEEEKLPKIVIVLDEFGDLMLQAKNDIQSRIIKLAQKARACGIHLILATQRPSVDCITGLIKSNLPTRIGFKVNSFDDSRTIFDIGGAEKLLGKGDSYFRSAENPDLARIQCCFVDTHEVQKVTDFVKANNESYFDQDVSDFINTVEQEETASPMAGGGEGEESETKIDDTFIKALKYCVTSNQASVSMIQRRFPVGYIKACKIIDWMENMNYITPSEGSKPRKVLLSKDEFFNIYGEVDD